MAITGANAMEQYEQLEVVNGLLPTDQVVVNPMDSLAEGTLVHVEGPKLNGTQKLGEETTTKKISGG